MTTKHLALLAAAGLLFGACQRHVEGDKVSVSAAHTRPAVEAAVPRVLHQAPRPASTEATSSSHLSADVQALLREQNLATLWQQDIENSRALDGFFGKDHYRIELALLSVEKDAAQPHVYHIKGKNRFKKRITPFEGTLTLTKVEELAVPQDDHPEDFQGNFYSAIGTLVLREEVSMKGSGVFEGRLATDFALQTGPDPILTLWYGPGTEQSPTMGSGFKFDGRWTDYLKNEVKPVVWADNFLAVATDVLKDFVVGERDVTINPKYAKAGWNNYWDNDEWWADPKVVRL